MDYIISSPLSFFGCFLTDISLLFRCFLFILSNHLCCYSSVFNLFPYNIVLPSTKTTSILVSCSMAVVSLGLPIERLNITSIFHKLPFS